MAWKGAYGPNRRRHPFMPLIKRATGVGHNDVLPAQQVRAQQLQPLGWGRRVADVDDIAVLRESGPPDDLGHQVMGFVAFRHRPGPRSLRSLPNLQSS